MPEVDVLLELVTESGAEHQRVHEARVTLGWLLRKAASEIGALRIGNKNWQSQYEAMKDEAIKASAELAKAQGDFASIEAILHESRAELSAAKSDADYERSQHAEFQCHWQIEKERADKACAELAAEREEARIQFEAREADIRDIRNLGIARQKAEAERDTLRAEVEEWRRIDDEAGKKIEMVEVVVETIKAERDAAVDNAKLMNEAASRHLRRAEEAEKRLALWTEGSADFMARAYRAEHERDEAKKELAALKKDMARAGGGVAMLVDHQERRVNELLEANNRYLERARKAERELAALKGVDNE